MEMIADLRISHSGRFEISFSFFDGGDIDDDDSDGGVIDDYDFNGDEELFFFDWSCGSFSTVLD